MEKTGEAGEMLTDEDLLTQVLSRLEVKYLLRCKAVSKTWLSLISSPSFIKSHIHRVATIAATDEIVIGRINTSRQEADSFSAIRLRSGDYVAHFKCPYSKPVYDLPLSRLVGSDCGIVCVCVCVCDVLSFVSHIYLWNPATKHSKRVPPHIIADDAKKNVAVGVGFDIIGFDFKVVRVVSRVLPAQKYVTNGNVWRNIEAEVYSANKNAWRKFEVKLTDVPSRANFGLCLHGYLFGEGFKGIMAFDLNKEVFVCEIDFPVNYNDYFASTLIVDYLDSVAVTNYSKFMDLDHKINLWTLDNEACFRGGAGGVEVSWTMMLSIDVGEQVFFRGLFNNVELLLLKKTQWFSYNFEKKVGKFLRLHPYFDYGGAFKYRESLLSIAGSELISWSDDDESEDDNGKSSAESEDDNGKSSAELEDDVEKHN